MYHEMADTFLFGRGGPKKVKLAIKYLNFAITGFENKQHSPIHKPITYDMAAFVAREGISPYVPGKNLKIAYFYKSKADAARTRNLELLKAQSTAYQDAVRRSRTLRASSLAKEREFDTGVMMVFGVIAAARIASTNFAQAPAPASNTGVKFGFPIKNYYGGYFPNNMNPPGQFFIPVR
jgi:hypothetical protein